MTLKNKSAISLIASTILVSSLSAGSLQIGTGAGTIASELFQAYSDYNVSVIGDTNATTKTGLLHTASFTSPTTVSDPAWEFTFSSAVEANASVNLYMVDANTSLIVSDAGSVNGTMLRFTSSAAVNIVDGGNYRVVATKNTQIIGSQLSTAKPMAAKGATSLMLFGTQTALEAASVSLEVYSMSGTPKLSDTATLDLFSVVPEYTVTCVNKFNNLIDATDSSLSFVETTGGRHANAIGLDLNNTDQMVFNVARASVDYSVGDNNGARLVVDADANTSLLVSTLVSGGAGWTTSVDALGYDFNITAGAGAVVLPGKNTDFTLTYETNGTKALAATNFTATYYVDYADYNSTVTPAGSSSITGSIGQWQKFAYIAQIGGATANSNIKTKLFVTNRSCAAVVPQFTLVYGGMTTTVSAADIAGKTSVAADTQVIYTVNEIADIAIANGFDVGTGALSVEITVPGNPEDFYVYAQSKNASSADGFKDLPVYNTSTRSN